MNDLIFGKLRLDRIVSIEVTDNVAEVFIQDEEGNVQIDYLPNKYWILSDKPLGNGWNKLKGELHYQYGKQFTFRDDFMRARQVYKDDDTFSIYNPKEALMVKDGFCYYQGMKHNEVTVLAFDIEATSLEYTKKDKVLLISNTFRKNGKIERKLFAYDEFKSQKEMLEAWTKWVRDVDPSIICGHNIYGYDLPYLALCADANNADLILGRDKSHLRFDNFLSKFRKDGSQFYHYYKAHCYGREFVDTMFLSLKYDIGRKYESYGLKSIIDAEGLQVKDRVFYDASQIRFKYKDPIEWMKIKQYAVHDGDDALALFDLMAPAFFYLAQSVPKPFQLMIESASGSQINSMMIRSYLQEGHSLPKEDLTLKFEGAISFGNPGIYKNVLKVDVASLYPSIMLEYQIFDKQKDPNGNLLQILKIFTDERLKNKKLAKDTGNKYYDDLQNAQKIVINSIYGFMGATGLLFNYPAGASMVTKKGREILNGSINWANSRFFNVVNGDTDSISFCKADMGAFTSEEEVDLLKDLNSKFPDRIHWEHDGIYKRFIILAGKNYVLDDGKKIKYKGSAIKATTKEKALQKFIKDIINSILEEKNNYTDIYNQYIKEIMDIKDMSQWVSKKTITEAIFKSERANETKIKDAIKGTDYVQGDKIYTYFRNDDTVGLLEHFDGNYSKERLLYKLHATGQIFDGVLKAEELFPNYKLKRNKQALALIA